MQRDCAGRLQRVEQSGIKAAVRPKLRDDFEQPSFPDAPVLGLVPDSL